MWVRIPPRDLHTRRHAMTTLLLLAVLGQDWSVRDAGTSPNGLHWWAVVHRTGAEYSRCNSQQLARAEAAELNRRQLGPVVPPELHDELFAAACRAVPPVPLREQLK